MTTFRPVLYPEDPAQRHYQLVSRVVVGEEVIENLGPVYRALAHGEEDRLDSVVVYDPDDFEPRRLVPVA
jgi:hypothetical protein